MGAVVGEILGFAVGVAISPLPIVAVILMLFTKKATSNSLGFVAGWIIGLFGAGLVVLAIGLEASDGGESTASGVVKALIGVVFLFMAWRYWSGRPKGDEEPEMPAWMAGIEGFSPVKSFGLAVLFSAVNPKNLGLTIAAAAIIGARGLETGEEIVVLVVFVLIASLTVVTPVVWYLLRRSKAEERLTEMKDWLIANNNTVMAILFVVLGAKLLGDGIAILL